MRGMTTQPLAGPAGNPNTSPVQFNGFLKAPGGPTTKISNHVSAPLASLNGMLWQRHLARSGQNGVASTTKAFGKRPTKI